MTEPVAPEPDPLLCPECGATPSLGKRDSWKCANCFSGGSVMKDQYLAVTWRYLGLHVGENAG